MGEIRNHRDLIAWQRARALVKETYSLTQAFPREEQFGLSAQMRRAAVSVPSNIAEGFGRGTSADFLRFLRMARGSLMELDTQKVLSEDLGFADTTSRFHDLCSETDRVRQGLIRSIEEKVQAPDDR
jgi:four helix bundle protein